MKRLSLISLLISSFAFAQAELPPSSGGGSGVTLGNFGSAPTAKGATLSAGELVLQPASDVHPGAMSTGDQDFSGFKYFTGGAAATDFYAQTIFSPILDADQGFSIVSVPLTLRGFPEATTGGFTNVIIDNTGATLHTNSKMLALQNFGTEKIAWMHDGTALPTTDNAINLGSASKRFAGAFVTTLNTGAITAPASTGMVLTSAVADSGSNIGFIMNTGALTGSTALLSIRNNSTEHVYLSRAGAFRIMQTTGSISAPFFGDAQGVARVTPNIFAANDGTDYRGRAADGATAVSHKFGNTVALTTAGALIGGFYNDASALTTLKFSIDKDGSTQSAAATLQTCALGIEGKISRNAATGGTTGVRTSACMCTSDGAGTPAYAWMHLTTGTVGTTTTCAP